MIDADSTNDPAVREPRLVGSEDHRTSRSLVPIAGQQSRTTRRSIQTWTARRARPRRDRPSARSWVFPERRPGSELPLPSGSRATCPPFGGRPAAEFGFELAILRLSLGFGGGYFGRIRGLRARSGVSCLVRPPVGRPVGHPAGPPAGRGRSWPNLPASYVSIRSSTMRRIALLTVSRRHGFRASQARRASEPP